MGVLNLQNFRDAVSLALGQRSDVSPSGAAGQALLDRWINDAYRYVCLPSVFRHPAMQASNTLTLVDGTTSYAMNSFDPAVYAIEFVINETKADRLLPETARELLDNPSGSDRRYARRGQALLIRATSASDGDTVRVYYWARPAILNDPANVSLVEEYWDQVIWRLAAGFAWANLGSQEKADYFNASAAQLINDHREARAFEAEDRGWQGGPSPLVSYSRTS